MAADLASAAIFVSGALVATCRRMSSGLTHIGAIARGLAYAPAAPTRASAPAAGQPATVDATRPVDEVIPTRDQIRDRVMAERGINPTSLFQASSQERIRAEIAIRVETAMRAMRPQALQTADARATGTLVDLRV